MSILIKQLTEQGNVFFRWRSYIPLILLLLGLSTYYYKLNTNHLQFTGIYIYTGLCLCFLGLVVRCMVVGYAAENTSGRNTSAQIADSINKTGLYSILRHPLYVGNFFMWLGICVMTMNLAFVVMFLLWYLLFYERIILAEEDYLFNKFSEGYKTYADRTPLIIPNFSLWHAPIRQFSWRRVLRQEKNGFAAIFIIIFIFEIIFNYHQNQSIINFDSIWFHLMIGSIGLYLILKFLKYKTKMLNPGVA